MPGEREANLGGAHEAVLAALIVMVGQFGGDGVKDEGEAVLDAAVKALCKVVGVQEVGGVVEEGADGLALALAQRGTVDEVRPRDSAWTNYELDSSHELLFGLF